MGGYPISGPQMSPQSKPYRAACSQSLRQGTPRRQARPVYLYYNDTFTLFKFYNCDGPNSDRRYGKLESRNFPTLQMADRQERCVENRRSLW